MTSTRRATWLRSAAAVAAASAVGVLIAVWPSAADPEPNAAVPSTSTTAPSHPASDADTTAETPSTSTAIDAVATLEVAGRAPMTGYDRDLFAYRSVDHDRNGCDVRNDVLRRDLLDVVIREGTQGCVVESGRLLDPYTGAEIPFVRGQATSSDVQIDHVVAMGNAWAMGAQQWDDATRHRFGNDPLNLLAVDGPTNQAKGAGDAATWLPPDREFRCAYVARQVSVKVAYDLRVTAAEQAAMQRILGQCPSEPLLTEADAATP